MSQTEDMATGLACACCGAYFIGQHGYQVVCRDCAEERSGLPEATYPLAEEDSGYVVPWEEEEEDQCEE